MIDVPLAQSPAFEEPLNSWKRVRVHTIEHAGDAVLYTCPNGHTARLTGWDIADDGAVSPSVDCSPNDCDFHDYIRLMDWSPVQPTAEEVGDPAEGKAESR